MDPQVFRSFIKEAMNIQTEDRDTPPGYVMVKAAVAAKFKIAGSAPIAPAGAQAAPPPQGFRNKARSFAEGARQEAGPAAGAVLGAGLANAYGISPVAGAAAGYGLGSVPELYHAIRHRI